MAGKHAFPRRRLALVLAVLLLVVLLPWLLAVAVNTLDRWQRVIYWGYRRSGGTVSSVDRRSAISPGALLIGTTILQRPSVGRDTEQAPTVLLVHLGADRYLVYELSGGP